MHAARPLFLTDWIAPYGAFSSAAILVLCRACCQATIVYNVNALQCMLPGRYLSAELCMPSGHCCFAPYGACRQAAVAGAVQCVLPGHQLTIMDLPEDTHAPAERQGHQSCEKESNAVQCMMPGR